MRKIMLDTNIYDAIVADSEFEKLFIISENEGFIDSTVTNIQLDQINRIENPQSDSKKFEMLYLVNLAGTTTTWGYFPDLSPKGWYTYAPKNEIIKFVDGKTLNRGNKEDALIASTAYHKGYTFITNDISLKNQYNMLGGEVMESIEFKESLQGGVNRKKAYFLLK